LDGQGENVPFSSTVKKKEPKKKPEKGNIHRHRSLEKSCFIPKKSLLSFLGSSFLSHERKEE